MTTLIEFENKVDENYENKREVENSGEAGKPNVNKDGQMTNNKVSGVETKKEQ